MAPDSASRARRITRATDLQNSRIEYHHYL
jgi:hypothetical protein